MTRTRRGGGEAGRGWVGLGGLDGRAGSARDAPGRCLLATGTRRRSGGWYLVETNKTGRAFDSKSAVVALVLGIQLSRSKSPQSTSDEGAQRVIYRHTGPHTRRCAPGDDARTRRARQTTMASEGCGGHPLSRRDPIQASHVVRDKKLMAGGEVRQDCHRDTGTWSLSIIGEGGDGCQPHGWDCLEAVHDGEAGERQKHEVFVKLSPVPFAVSSNMPRWSH